MKNIFFENTKQKKKAFLLFYVNVPTQKYKRATAKMSDLPTKTLRRKPRFLSAAVKRTFPDHRESAI
jgi:hypothetical protein